MSWFDNIFGKRSDKKEEPSSRQPYEGNVTVRRTPERPAYMDPKPSDPRPTDPRSEPDCGNQKPPDINDHDLNDLLSKNFVVAELIKSDTAERLKINNAPQEQRIMDNLFEVTNNVLQKVRDHYDRPLVVTSGFRSLPLNRALNSKDNSQHVQGEAADFHVPGVTNYEVAAWIRDNLLFDQLILEFYKPGQPNSGWIHCSFVTDRANRKETLIINESGARHGLIK